VSQIIQSFTDMSKEETTTRCSYCGLAAVCIGSDLAGPHYRCPRHCREHEQLGGYHGDPNYMNGHEYAEGVEVVGGVV